MGQQLTFAMDSDDEQLFLEYLNQNNYIIYKNGIHTMLETINAFPPLFSGQNWHIFYLYNPNFGTINLKNMLKDKIAINPTIDPVIEFKRTIIRSNKTISFGRIWIEMRYYDENGKLTKKNQELNDGYKNMKKWILKLLNKEGISKSLLKLIIEDGYKFD